MVEKMQSPAEGRKRLRNNVGMPICEMNAEPREHLKVLEGQVCTLLCSIRAQHQALENAYSELEVERNASATAIDEATKKISKLQEEKAKLEMEASQFQRETEHKMAYAEQALGFYEELLLSADEEIKALQSEVQAYRLKYGVCDSERTGNVASLPERTVEERFGFCKSDRMEVPFTCDNLNGSMGKILMGSSHEEPLNQDFAGESLLNQVHVGFLDETYDKECVECDKYEVIHDNDLSPWDQFQKQSDSLYWRHAEDASRHLREKQKVVCSPTDLSTEAEAPEEDRELIKHVIAPAQATVAQEACKTKEDPHMIVKRPPSSKSGVLASFTKALIVGLFLGSLKTIMVNKNRC